MSDHVPSWMPSDETLRATAHNCTLYANCYQPDPMEDLRALLATAVEKALAEQEACYRREVLQAKIDTLDDLWHATKRDHSGKAVEVAFASHVTPSFIREEVNRLAAELAALDAGEEAKP